MRRYETDRYGMISSYDIAEALRRAERRRLAADHARREREAKAVARAGWLARIRGLVVAPPRSAA